MAGRVKRWRDPVEIKSVDDAKFFVADRLH